MKRWLPHLVFIVIFIAQSSVAIAMATQMQTHLPAQTDTSGSHCVQHSTVKSPSATTAGTAINTNCQYCSQTDCSHCHCMGNFSVLAAKPTFIAAKTDVPHYTGFSLTTTPDTPPQRILRPPRFIA